ncbi:MAG: SDR family oxidoreductase, partial [Elusimicrobia bacterium]|nr:SDR family oxidoreductase [Elusimicrobiota bacterium]
ASSGIGLATCQKFKEKGWYVIGAARRRMKSKSPFSRYIMTDMADITSVKRLAADIISSEKGLDVIVNNAACQICKPLLNTTVDDWNMVHTVNVVSPLVLAQSLYSLLKKHGVIVNIASVHAIATSPHIGAYASSKGALVALTRSMAIEFASDNIRVNAVLPGAVDTPMLRDGLQRGHIKGKTIKHLLAGLGRHHIMGRVGAPEEIADVIYFCADNAQSSFMTGQTIIVDGGALCKLSTE